jgi:cation-transporting P-type ATPase I
VGFVGISDPLRPGAAAAVARQAADVVLADDRFETLTEALLEGRSLWHNPHGAPGLLLGGNLGEIALMARAALAGGVDQRLIRDVVRRGVATGVPALAAVLLAAPSGPRPRPSGSPRSSLPSSPRRSRPVTARSS